MLRPQLRTSSSRQRITRSPLIKATDDDHPLLPAIPDNLPYNSGADSRLNPSRTCDATNTHEPECDVPTHKRRAGDTEVYVHRVTKADTLPRIILQYKVPVQILRRANKLWANDSIQSKDTLLLPVEACGIKPELLPDLTSSLIVTPQATASTSIAVLQSANQSLQALSLQRSPSGMRHSAIKKEKVASKKPYNAIRQVLIDGIGLVDVACVQASSLSYFPPSMATPQSSFAILARSSMDRPRCSLDSSATERGSFEALRMGAGQIAADAYNGTAGLIRRLKDKKHDAEIDLIEL